MAPVTRPSMRHGPMPTSSFACRSESLKGLENVEAIAAVEDVDMIAYGHSDLSARLGVHLQLTPDIQGGGAPVAEACGEHGKLARGSA